MSDKISIAGWARPPTDSIIANLSGSVLHVLVGGFVLSTGTPWGEFFRFARVIETELVPSGLPTTCIRCDSESRWRITVDWEAGFISPNGNVVCENCADGVVTNGAELIDFATVGPSQ